MNAESRSAADSPKGRWRIFDRPTLLLCLAYLFWSGNVVVGRAVVGELPPIALAFWRWVLGFLILLPFVARSLPADLRVFLSAPGIVVFLSFVGITLFNTVLYIGLTETTAVNASLIQPLMPAVIVILSFLFFRDRFGLIQSLGLCVSFLGAVLVVVRGDFDVLLAFRPNVGDIWIFAGLFIYGVYTVWLRRKPAMTALGFVAMTFFLGAVMLLPAYLIERAMETPPPITVNTIAAVLYVAIFPTILAFFFFNRGVELAGANRSALLYPLIPLFGSTMAVLFLGETVAWFHGAGMILILGGIYLAMRSR